MRTAILEYLDALGITPELTRYVHRLSYEKDRRNFIIWLGEVTNFVEKGNPKASAAPQ